MTIGGEGLLYQETSGSCFGIKGKSELPDSYYCHYAVAGYDDYMLGMHVLSFWVESKDIVEEESEEGVDAEVSENSQAVESEDADLSEINNTEEEAILMTAPTGFVDSNNREASILLDDDVGANFIPEWLCDP